MIQKQILLHMLCKAWYATSRPASGEATDLPKLVIKVPQEEDAAASDHPHQKPGILEAPASPVHEPLPTQRLRSGCKPRDFTCAMFVLNKFHAPL